jgi:TP901 family phage tail tape measure protein
MPIVGAQIKAVISADTSQAEQGLNRVGGMLGKALPSAAIGGATAVLGVAVAATKMAGDFQAGMTQLVTGAGEAAGPSGIGKVAQGILKLAVDTGTTTSQLQAGAFMVESAGFHGAAALDVLRASAQGAKVGAADLGTVADATTTILTDFGKTGINANQAVNALVSTVSRGKTHMADLAGAMAQILPTASAAGVGLSDVMGAMATMTGEGVPAANSATYLRQTILALVAPSKQTIDALKGVGLSASDVAGAMKESMPDALNMIQNALAQKFPASAQLMRAEMTKVQKGTETFDQALQNVASQGGPAYVAALKNIAGGSKQMQGLLDLTGDHMKTFDANVLNIGKNVHFGATAIAGWSDVQNDFNFKVDRAKEVVETFMIRLGTGLLPIAGKIVDFFSNSVIPGIEQFADSFNKPSSQIGNLASAAARTLMPVLSQLGGMIKTDVVPAVVSIASFITSTVLPAGIKFATWFAQAAVPVLKTLADVIAKDVLPTLTNIGGILLTKVLPPVEGLIGKVAPVLNPALQFLGFVLKNVVGPAIGVVLSVIGGLLEGLNKIAGAVTGAFHFVKNTVSSVVDAITGKAEEMRIKSGISADQMKVKQISEMQQSAQQSIAAIQTQKEGILAQLALTKDPAKRHALEMRLAVLNEHQQLLEQSVKSAQQRKEKILAHEQQLRQQAILHAQFMKYGILGHVAELGYNMVNSIKQGVTNFLNTLGGLKDRAIAWAGNFVTGILNGLASLPGKFLALGGQIIQQLASGISGAYGAVKTAIGNIPVIGGAVGFVGNFIPHFAKGGTMGSTGIAVVGEEGPELAQLPGGTRITPLAGTRGGNYSLPAGMSQAYGMATGTANEQPLIVNLYMDATQVARIVTKLQPGIIRHATGARNF